MNAVVRLLPYHVSRRVYLAVLTVMTTLVTMVFGATSAVAGLSFDNFLRGDASVALLNVFLLALLLFPAIAVAVRGLSLRRMRVAWIVPLYFVGVFAVMAIFFGKPFALAEAPGVVKLLPTFVSLFLCGWIVAEITLARRETLAAAVVAD